MGLTSSRSLPVWVLPGSSPKPRQGCHLPSQWHATGQPRGARWLSRLSVSTFFPPELLSGLFSKLGTTPGGRGGDGFDMPWQRSVTSILDVSPQQSASCLLILSHPDRCLSGLHPPVYLASLCSSKLTLVSHPGL